jgi:hypothetical protein
MCQALVPLGRLRITWKNSNKRDVWEADCENRRYSRCDVTAALLA